MRTINHLLAVAALCLLTCFSAKAQDSLFFTSAYSLAFDYQAGMTGLEPGYDGGAIVINRSLAFPATARTYVGVLDKDVNQLIDHCDGTKAGSFTPMPTPPFPLELNVNIQDAVMADSLRSVLIGNYLPSGGLIYVPFLELTKRTGATYSTTVKLPPAAMMLQHISPCPTGNFLVPQMKGVSQAYLTQTDADLNPIWTKKLDARGCVASVFGDIYYPIPDGVGKMRGDGTVLWNKTYGAWETLQLLPNPDGGISVLFIHSTPPTWDQVVVRMDSAGNVLWARQVPAGEGITEITHGVGSSSLLLLHTMNQRVTKLDGNGNAIWTVRYLTPTLPAQRGITIIPGPHGGFWAYFTQEGFSGYPPGWIEESSLFIKADSMGNTNCVADPDTLLFSPASLSAVSVPFVQPMDTVIVFGVTSDVTEWPGGGGPLSDACITDCPAPVATPAITASVCTEPYTCTITLPPGYSWGTTFVTVNGSMLPMSIGSTRTISLMPDTNIIQVVIPRGGICRDTFNYVVDAAGAPPKPDLGPDIYLCPGSSVVLHAGSGYTMYEWAGPGGSWLPGDSTRTISTTGVKIVRVSDAAGCTSTDTLVVLAPGPVPISGTTTFCSGGSTLLSVDSSATGVTWSTGGSGPTTWASSAGTVTATGTDTLGCTFTSSITLSTYTVSVPISGPSFICPGGSAVLSLPVSTSDLLWSTTDTTPTTEVTAAGTYTATGSDSAGCLFSSSFSLPLSVIYPPGLPDSLLLCQMHTAWLTPAGPYSSLVWSDGSAGDSLLVSLPGTYSVTTFNADGCPAEDTCTVFTYSSPSAFFSYTGGWPTLSFTNFSSSSSSYIWDFGDGYGSTATHPTHTYLTDGTWHVCLTAINDCDTSIYCEDIVITSTTQSAPEGIRVWPNPFESSVEVSLPATCLGGHWQLYAPDGRALLSGDITAVNFRLATAQLPAGNYLLLLSADHLLQTVRIEKIR